MKRFLIFALFILFAGATVFTSCEKDDAEPAKPTVSFKNTTGYTFGATTAKYGDTVKVGFTAKSNGTDNLVKFSLYANGQKMKDSTINVAEYTVDYSLIKGTADKEVWKFEITDVANKVTSDSIVITANFGEIKQYASITLGAQDNATLPTFLSLTNSDSLRYFLAQAFDNQANVDMFLFYEAGIEMTFAAPASNITGIFSGQYDPNTYTTKNLTRYSDTPLTAAQFDAVANDAQILANFTAPAGKYKKSANLVAGKVIAFQTQAGKYGLIKIKTVNGSTATGSADGTVEFALKIQK